MIFLSLLTSIALVISLFESSMPLPIGVPGAKLGLSNLVILVTIVVYGAREGVIVALLKSALLLLITGSVTGFWYSISGAFLAALAMGLSYRFLSPMLSLIGISELGALAHNVGQLFIAMLVLENRAIFVYLPVLTLVGLATGFFVGLSANTLAPHLERVSVSQLERRHHARKHAEENQGMVGGRPTDGKDDASGGGGAF